jgi:hypothetical protein
MRWLHATALFSLLLALGWAPFFACSSDDSSATTGSLDAASQPPATKLEAGSACGQTNDCEPGLVCLYPASSTSTCNEYPVCVTQPFPCTQPQTMCSCLVEPIQVCQGYAQNAVDPTITCDGGVVVVPGEAGAEGGIDAAAPVDASEAGSVADAGSVAEAGSVADAADAAGE